MEVKIVNFWHWVTNCGYKNFNAALLNSSFIIVFFFFFLESQFTEGSAEKIGIHFFKLLDADTNAELDEWEFKSKLQVLRTGKKQFLKMFLLYFEIFIP